ncbi:MAG TPA: COX15/CtaA family protein, partial [Cryomorphaceae bacterium]|nr:COX15/CtaA family protein [Cryomorphaceae bacterium]
LGKEVVDGNLIPHQITYHMFGALALVALFTFIVVRTKPNRLTFRAKRDKAIVRLGLTAIALLLVQIYLGTSVREEVDAIGKSVLLAMPDWVEALSVKFKIHRTFSIAVLAIVMTFAVRVIRGRTISTWPRILIASVFLEILFGMGLVYMDLPGPLQPLHLLFAFFSFAMILGILLSYLQKTVE